MKKILITGGAGFIGSHIAKECVKKGYNVVIYDNLSTGKISNFDMIKDKITFIKGDILDKELLNKSLNEVDYVFHDAALVSVFDSVKRPFDNQRINEEGMLNVFEFSRKNNVKKIVCASSAAVYGDSLELPKTESMKSNPKSPYGVSKHLMELYAKIYTDLYKLPIICLRYFNVFGPNQDPTSPYSGVLSIFANAFKRDIPNIKIFGDGNQTRDFIYVKDVALANLLALENDKMNGGIFNLGNGCQKSLNQILKILEKITNKKPKIEFYDFRKGDIKYSYCSNEKIKSMGYNNSYNFNEGLEEYLKSEKVI